MAIALACIGFACILYGLVIMTAWSGTWFFAVWYAIGAAFVCIAFAVHSGAWEQLNLVLRRIIEVAGALFFACVLVCGGLALSGFQQKGADGLDYLIVLGAQVRDDGPSKVLRYRLDAACDYLAENPDTVCIVSGGKGPNEPLPEADAMADYLVSHGVDEKRIVREAQASNTAENIGYSMALIGSHDASVGIVTNDFHVFRGVGIARKLGLSNACGIAAPSDALFLPNNLLRESLSIAKDYATGNL